MKKVIFVLLFIGLLFALEPSLRSKLTFAVPLFSGQETTIDNDANHALTQPMHQHPLQKTRAPEPATIVLFFGGITGIIVRFVRKSFEEIKRYIDMMVAVFALTVTMPIILFAAIAIKITSPGPIIYSQTRVGRSGKNFRIFKLRTMSKDAEKGTGAVWAKKNDSRITLVGKLLRKSRVDELPQLINVIRGEMSIVGPRPERPEMVKQFKVQIEDYEKRLAVKPGITGVAQVFHKYDETIADVRKKVKYDLLYIKKMCLWTDLNIMGRTFSVVLTGKGAN